jgi:predicted DsbA family dithiol-disulfide isomerase
MSEHLANGDDSIIQIVSDFICPWCWIGEENLHRALVATERPDDRRIIFVPYQLNPHMPAAGMDRKAYRSAKFGSWAHSQALDAQVAQAGRAVGLNFACDRVKKTPNTLAAHRLVWREQHAGKNAVPLVRALFSAYFAEGQDIGDVNVLADIAGDTGLNRLEALSFLVSSEGRAEVLALEATSRVAGIRSVPSIHIGEHVISGAQPVEVMLEVLRRCQPA